MTFNVITATLEHAPAIAQFNQFMAQETEAKSLEVATILAGVTAAIEDPSRGFYLVACKPDGRAIGCLAVTYEWSDWRNGCFWWVQSVYVEKDHRTCGVFSRMYETVKMRAHKDKLACGIRLYVEQDNQTAMRTYLRLGMIETQYRLMEEEF